MGSLSQLSVKQRVSTSSTVRQDRTSVKTVTVVVMRSDNIPEINGFNYILYQRI